MSKGDVVQRKHYTKDVASLIEFFDDTITYFKIIFDDTITILKLYIYK